MPKAQKLSANKGAVLARKRREKEKENSQYSEALKEFLKLKYNHVIEEFNPMYVALKNNRPRRLKYTNTREFHLWQKQEIARLMSVQQQEQPHAAQSEDEQPHAIQSVDEQVFEEQRLVNDLANLYDEVIGNNNDHVNLYEEVVANNDEGIELDLWEELNGDIEEFDYRMEVELDQYLH